MDINSIGLDMALRKLDEVTAQRDDLLAALKEARIAILVAVGRKSHVRNALRIADSAIAKCEVKS